MDQEVGNDDLRTIPASNRECDNSEDLAEFFHDDEKSYIKKGKIDNCVVCDRAFIWPSALRIHLRTHSGVKPYKCDQCSFACNQASKFKIHFKKHLGEKSKLCNQCNYACFDLRCILEVAYESSQRKKVVQL